MDNSQKSVSKISVLCPECDTELPVPADVKKGTIIECPACGTECECISVEPLQFTPLEEEK